MDIFLARHTKSIEKLEKLKSTIECTGAVCKRVPLIPQSDYDEWLEVVKKSGDFKEDHELRLVQQRFNVLCNKLFTNRGDYLVYKSNKNDNDFATINNNTIHIAIDKLSPQKIDVQLKHAYFLARDLKHMDNPHVELDSRNFTFRMIWDFYNNTTLDQHLIAYLLSETIEKTPSINVITSNQAQLLLWKFVSKVIDKRIRSKIVFT